MDCDEWLVALDNAQSGQSGSTLDISAIETLATASANPWQFRLMSEALDQRNDGPKNNWPLLVESVDESPYSLSEWLAAWEFFSQWLAAQNRQAEFSIMMGYLDCCSEWMEGKSVLPPFDLLVEEMLEAFGFEGAQSR